MAFCPIDGTLMKDVGSAGIVDWDGRWDAQATKFECTNEKGKHSVFVTEYQEEEWGASAFQAAYDAINKALEGSHWGSNVVRIGRADKSLSGPITSLDDLRHQLATMAVEVFKEEIAGHPDPLPGRQTDEYEYIHAIEDVDEILGGHQALLEEMQWRKKE